MKLSQMQALKSQKGGFTLVELIVVITILAILATVGFLSFQNYTKDAKSATVRENIGQLASAMNTKGAQGGSMATLINTGTTDKTITVGTGKTVFAQANTTNLVIKAGDVNYASIPGIDSSKMNDADGTRAALAGFAASSANSALQIASTIKDGELNKVYVIGNFTADAAGAAGAGSVGAVGLIGGTTAGTELVNDTTGTHR